MSRPKARKRKQKPYKIPNRLYEKELLRLQEELVQLQEWIKYKSLRLSWFSRGATLLARAV